MNPIIDSFLLWKVTTLLTPCLAYFFVIPAYNNSIQIAQEHGKQLQQYQLFHQQTKTRVAQMDSTYQRDFRASLNQWKKRKQEHDQHKIKSSFPTRWDRVPEGTPACQKYMNAGGVYSILGTCMADIVDASILFGQGKLTAPPLEPFVPPRRPADQVIDTNTGETLAQYTTRNESEWKRNLTVLESRLSVSEDERRHAWKKLMRVKVEIELPQLQAQSRGRGMPTAANFLNAPCPPLRQNGQQPLPRDYNMPSRAAVPTYMPAASSSAGTTKPGGGVGLSTLNMPKYTASGVQQRTSRDGSVAPVSEPKKTPDGLYQRPAGRQRKGMQWDAVRGIWVPE